MLTDFFWFESNAFYVDEDYFRHNDATCRTAREMKALLREKFPEPGFLQMDNTIQYNWGL